MKALAFSGGKDSMACLHLLRDDLDLAIYVDTGYAYPETLEMVEYAKTIIPVKVVMADRERQNVDNGIGVDVLPIDWTSFAGHFVGKREALFQSYLSCCFENISRPLFDFAKNIGVKELVYGQRSDESHKSPSRDGALVEGIVRRHPIESWTTHDVLTYLETKMDVPWHFKNIEHTSLDCYDCVAYRSHSGDRVRWTKTKHPELYAAYDVRRRLIDSTLVEALKEH